VEAQRSNAENMRAAPRTAMFVAAVLRFGTQSIPVRIRNMSATGALIEGAAFPPAGTAIRLVRSELSIDGSMAWVEPGRAGLSLSGQVSVADWMHGKASHQQVIDRMVAEVRATPAQAQAPVPGPGLDSPGRDEGEELRAICELLARLEAALLSDERTVARHAVDLQAIDEAQQRLAALLRKAAA